MDSKDTSITMIDCFRERAGKILHPLSRLIFLFFLALNLENSDSMAHFFTVKTRKLWSMHRHKQLVVSVFFFNFPNSHKNVHPRLLFQKMEITLNLLLGTVWVRDSFVFNSFENGDFFPCIFVLFICI